MILCSISLSIAAFYSKKENNFVLKQKSDVLDVVKREIDKAYECNKMLEEQDTKIMKREKEIAGLVVQKEKLIGQLNSIKIQFEEIQRKSITLEIKSNGITG